MYYNKKDKVFITLNDRQCDIFDKVKESKETIISKLSYHMSINNGNRTEWSPILSVIILVINKSDSRVNHSYDYRPNWTPLSPITIINQRPHSAEE